MNKIRKFERRIGGRWTGIKFHRGNVPDENISHQSMRFCEAIKASTTLSKELGIGFSTAPAISIEDFDKIMAGK